MSWNWADIQASLKDCLETIDGLHVYDYNVTAPAVPAVLVLDPDEIRPYGTMQTGVSEIDLTLLLLVLGTDRSASDAVSDYISTGDKSIWQALRDGRPTVNALWDASIADCHVSHMGDFAYYDFGQASYPGCKAYVTLLAKG